MHLANFRDYREYRSQKSGVKVMLSRLNRFTSAATEEARESSWTLFQLLVAAMFLTHGYDKLLRKARRNLSVAV
jgi:hypothetical protein